MSNKAIVMFSKEKVVGEFEENQFSLELEHDNESGWSKISTSSTLIVISHEWERIPMKIAENEAIIKALQLTNEKLKKHLE